MIELQLKYPNDSFLGYINETAEHLNYGEPRLVDGTIARIWPHVNTIWADDAFMAISFLARMGKLTGDEKYFNDAANQVLNYNRYLWCPEADLLSLLSYRQQGTWSSSLEPCQWLGVYGTS